MSIKVKIFSVVVLLTTLALGQAGFQFIDAQSSVNRNNALLTASQRESLLLEMVALAGEEQMHIFSLLTSSKRLRKDRLEAAKTAIDERLTKFDNLLDRLGATGLTDETAQLWEALADHRSTAIEETQKSAMVRDVKASRIWLEASSQAIAALAAEGIAAVPHDLVVDPDTELYLVRIKMLSAASQSLAQYAALYGGLLSSRGHLHVELMREIAHLEGEFRHSIFEVFDGFVPIVTAEGTMLSAEDFLNSPLNSLASQIVEHAVQGGEKPEGATTANWFALTELALGDIAQAMDATKDALSLHVGKTNKAAIIERNISATIVASCLVAILVSIWVVSTGVLRPLKLAVRHVDILAEGDNSIDVTDLPDTNEFGLMRSALQKLVSMSRQVEVLNAKNAENDARQRESERQAAQEEAKRLQQEQEAAEREKEILAQAQKAERAAAQEIARVVAACAEGNFSKRLDISDKTGVFKELCEGLNKIGEVTSENLEEVREVLEHVATGNLTHRMAGSFNGTFASIAEAMNQTTESLTETMEKIHKSAGEVENSASVMAKQSDVLSTRSSDSASMLQQTSSSLADINGSVSAVEGSAKIAMNAIEKIANQASAGKLVVSSAITAMDEIKESSNSIAKILMVIEDIAFQTNLLALNAGVEAARAGDSGKGFAVVANEVRALAARSSEAGGEISDLISAATDNVEKGVSLVRNTGDELERIAESVDDATGKISDIVNDSSESAVKIREVTSSIKELEKATQQNYDMVERSSQSVQSLRSEASVLFDSVDAFQLEKLEAIRKSA